MAKAKKPAVEIEVDETEAEETELDDLDELEALADEVENGDDDDSEEEDGEDEAPKKKSKAGKKGKAGKGNGKGIDPSQRGLSDGAIGTSELAEALGTDGKNLRVMLRDKEAAKNENGRYEWSSVKSAVKALGFKSLAEAQEALAESRNKRLEALKEKNAEKKAAEAADGKKGKKKKKAKKNQPES